MCVYACVCVDGGHIAVPKHLNSTSMTCLPYIEAEKVKLQLEFPTTGDEPLILA